MRKALSYILSAAMALLPFAGVPAQAQQTGPNPPSNQSFVTGRFVARNYNYPGIQITTGVNNPAGSATIKLRAGSVRLPDGRVIVPFSAGGQGILGQAGFFPAIPITVGAGSVKETVTPTAVSGCYVGAPDGSCSITATFANAHGSGEVVTSGSFGIQEAINDASFWGGGLVEVDSSLRSMAGGLAAINVAEIAAIPMAGVTIEDTDQGVPQYWNPQGGLTTLAAPATLTAVTVGFGLNGANTTSGTYTGGSTYHVAVAYVDQFGQEGPASADFSALTAGSGSTNQIGFAAPAASTGAVGYTIYISLAAGSYNLAYKVPLATFGAGGATTANGVCTLTSIETVTPACRLTNTSFGQTGVTAQVSALTLNTSPIVPQVTVVSTTSVYVPNAGGRTAYTYVPSSRVGIPNLPSTILPFTISAVDATTVPSVIGTVNLPPGFMNIVGRTLRICGRATTSASTSTINNIQFQWDAVGQNTAGKGVPIGDMSVTSTSATAKELMWCEDFQTTVAGTGATAGSINTVGGLLNQANVTLIAGGGGGETIVGATASLNLASEARINVIYLHTTGTDGTAVTLQGLTLQVL
jgi:hypothetical protein